MKAYVLHGINDLRYEDVPVPKPAPDEVLVRVCAAGICGSDIPRIYKTGAHRHPLIPGHEFSGKVEAVGTGVNASWLHKRVGIFPLIPCGKCDSCRKKQYEMCRDYDYLGSRRDGGFAEYVTVPEWNLLELPDRVSYAEAAMLEPMAVAVHAMRKNLGELLGDLQALKECSVVVCGLGTIGLLLAMFLREAGVSQLFLVGNKDFQRRCVGKLEIAGARECGCRSANFVAEKLDGRETEESARFCDSRTTDVAGWVRERTAGRMADVVFECVGKNETVSQAIDLAAPGGRVMLVGNPTSDMLLEKQIYWKILRNQLTVRGTWNSSYDRSPEDDWHYVLKRLESGRIHPAELISHCFSLAELTQGFGIMRDKSEDYVKIMWG